MPLNIGENNKIEATRSVSINQARDYLRKQLASPSPNITTIYNTVKNVVDNNPTLLQMVNNQITITQNCFGFVINLVLPTPVDRQRYLFAVEIVVGLLA